MTTAAPRRSKTRSSDLYDRTVSVMPDSNTRTTAFTHSHSLYAVRGAGPRIWDADSKTDIDVINYYTSLIRGHTQPEGLFAACVLAAPTGLMALSTPMTDTDVHDVIGGVQCALGL